MLSGQAPQCPCFFYTFFVALRCLVCAPTNEHSRRSACRCDAMPMFIYCSQPGFRHCALQAPYCIHWLRELTGWVGRSDQHCPHLGSVLHWLLLTSVFYFWENIRNHARGKCLLMIFVVAVVTCRLQMKLTGAVLLSVAAHPAG
jgi:hypothetical protein